MGKKLTFTRLADLPAAERLNAARQLVARDPHMPAHERQRLFEIAMYPSDTAGGWTETDAAEEAA